MIRDPATRALNQMWAEEREDADEEKGSLPHVVPSIGESMAVRLLRAKASSWSNLNALRMRSDAVQEKGKAVLMSTSQGRAWSKEVEDKGRHLLTLEREGADAAWGFSLVGGREVMSVDRETRMTFFQVLENGGFSSGVATKRREEVKYFPQTRTVSRVSG